LNSGEFRAAEPVIVVCFRTQKMLTMGRAQLCEAVSFLNGLAGFVGEEHHFFFDQRKLRQRKIFVGGGTSDAHDCA